jgi:hypothetical protein
MIRIRIPIFTLGRIGLNFSFEVDQDPDPARHESDATVPPLIRPPRYSNTSMALF